MFLGGKNVKICDFGQKKPSEFGEDLFFGDHLLLVGKFVISARKSLRISAKTFALLILILPPRSLEAGDAPARSLLFIQFPLTIFEYNSTRVQQQMAKVSSNPLIRKLAFSLTHQLIKKFFLCQWTS